MTCQTSSVAITAASVSQVAQPIRHPLARCARGRYRDSQAIGERQLTSVPPRLCRSSTASAMMATRTASAPSAITSLLQGGGRRDEPGVDIDAGREPRLWRAPSDR